MDLNITAKWNNSVFAKFQHHYGHKVEWGELLGEPTNGWEVIDPIDIKGYYFDFHPFWQIF